jgi:hypothetical protein
MPGLPRRVRYCEDFDYLVTIYVELDFTGGKLRTTPCNSRAFSVAIVLIMITLVRFSTYTKQIPVLQEAGNIRTQKGLSS